MTPSPHRTEDPDSGASTADRAEELAYRCLEVMAGGQQASVDELIAAEPPAVREHVGRLLATLTRIGLDACGPPADAPDRLGPFRLLERVGAGTMGVVYRAQRDDADGALAVKVLQPGLLRHEGARQRFRREVKALRALDHAGICPVVDDGEADGVPYLVMPFVDGRSLADLMEAARRGGSRMPLDDAMRILTEVAEALHHAHERGFVHRDVKPANVIVRPDGHAVVLDFGLSRLEQSTPGMASLTLSGATVGTPAYMAPEQIAGARGIDRRCDVYAVGVMLFEAATGRLPFHAPTREVLYRWILERDAERPSLQVPSVSRAFDVVCMTALARDPDRRYQSAAELAADLDRLRRGQTPNARLPGSVRRLTRWVRRNPVPSAMLAVTSVALAGVAALALRDHERSKVIEGRAMAAEAIGMAQADPVGALQLGVDAYDRSKVAESLTAIQCALDTNQPELEFRLGAADPGDRDAVPALAFREDGAWLVAAGTDGWAHAWDLRGREYPSPVELRHGDGVAIRNVAWQPNAGDDALVVTSGVDGRVCAFVPATGESRWQRDVIPAGTAAPEVRWAPGGQRLLVADERGVQLWSARGEVLAPVPESDRASAVAWLDDATCAVAHATPGTPDASTVAILSIGEDHHVEPRPRCELPGRVVAIHPRPRAAAHGDLLLVTDSGLLSLWRPGVDAPRRLSGEPGGDVVGAGWSHDGTRMFAASRPGILSTWSADGSGESRRVLGEQLRHALASPAEDLIARIHVTGDGVLQRFDSWSVFLFGRRSLRGGGVAFSTDGLRFATVTRDHAVQVWRRFDPELPRVLDRNEQIHAVAWSGAGREVVAGSTLPAGAPQRGRLRTWDRISGQQREVRWFERGVSGLWADPDDGDRWLVCTGHGGHGRVHLVRRQSGGFVDEVEPLLQTCVLAQFVGRDRILLVDESSAITLWTPREERPLRTVRAADPSRTTADRLLAAAATPDGSKVWAGGHSGYLERFDAEAGGYREADRVWLGNSILALHVLPDPDGSLLVGGANGLLQRRFANPVREPVVFPAAQRHVRALDSTIVDDELRIASGDLGGRIVLWDGEGGMIREVLAFARGVLDVRFSADGSSFVAGADGGAVCIRPTRTDDLLNLAQARLRRAGRTR